MNICLKIIAVALSIVIVSSPVLGIKQSEIDKRRSQASEVLTGEIVNVDNTPNEWNFDLTDFNSAGISVKEISSEPDSYIEISNPDEYPYLQQAIEDIHQESWGQHGSVTFHSFDETTLDELISGDLNFIEINDTYYEVYFLAIDPMAPLSIVFDKYFEIEVTNVEKTSTNLTSNEIIRILYLDSQVYEHIKRGELVNVWVKPVSDNMINQNLDIALYKTSGFMEGHDVEVFNSTADNDEETAQTEAVQTETPNINGFSGVLGFIIIFYTKKFVANI